METIVVLLPVEGQFDRKTAESIEGESFTREELSIYPVLQEAELYKLFEFTTLCNDEDFFPDHYWITYILLKES